jgi:hypothetical protein
MVYAFSLTLLDVFHEFFHHMAWTERIQQYYIIALDKIATQKTWHFLFDSVPKRGAREHEK